MSVVAFGAEFLVNTTTVSRQREPSILSLSDGRFLVAWEDGSGLTGDNTPYGLVGQIFNADGSKSGGEFSLNTTTQGLQTEVALAKLADGRFIATWTDESGQGHDTDPPGVKAQIFNPAGTKSGPEFDINEEIEFLQSQSSVTGLSDGRFVAVWMDGSGNLSDPDFGIRVQIFNADGTRSGAEFLVNTTKLNTQFDPDIVELADGGFAVVWTDESRLSPDTSVSAVRLQIFNADGTLRGSEKMVNTLTSGEQSQATLAALPDGRFVVTWTDRSAMNGDNSLYSIRAQIFAADGQKVGGELVVNTTTDNSQTLPEITALPDGRFVVVWVDISASGGDTSLAAVRAQVFDTDGTKVGAEFLVNTTTLNAQDAPDVTVLADGRIAFVWTDQSKASGADSDWDIRGQIFDPRVAAVDLAGSLANDWLYGTGFNDSLAGFAGQDTLNGAAGQDRLWGEGGDDRLSGAAGQDTLDGGVGNDWLEGGAGSDSLTGGSGNDVFVIDGFDRVIEFANGGIDRVESALISVELTNYAQVENATLTGQLALNLTGSSGGNLLTGNGAANLISGGGGADRIIGAQGADTLIGGAGRDRFVFATAAEANGDVISDFSKGDKIDLSAYMDGGRFIGGKTFSPSGTQAEVRYVKATGVLQGDVNGDGIADWSLTLQNKATLAATDFLF